MGCSDSKADQNHDKPQGNGQQCEKPPEQDQHDENDVYITTEEAEKYIIEKVSMNEENAKKMVQKMDKDEDGQIYKKELADMCNTVNKLSEDLAQKFREIDKDGNGYVSADEAELFIHKHMSNIPDKTVKLIIRRFEKEGSQGRVDYEGFVHFYAIISAMIRNLRNQFNALDVDADGKLSQDELGETLSNVCGLPEWQSKLLMELYDVDNDGKIDRQEFNTMLTEVFGTL